MEGFDFFAKVHKINFSDKYQKFFVFSGNFEKLFSFGKFFFSEKYKTFFLQARKG